MAGKSYPSNKTRGWLKNVLTARSEFNQIQNEPQHPSNEDPELNAGTLQEHSESDYSWLDKDKTALDLVMAVENLLNDRQLSQFKAKDTEDQLDNANEVINRLKNDLSKKEHLLLEKDKEYRVLEDKLTSKQMSYDQLLEDYKEYQNSTNTSIENLKYQLEKERSKYAKLNEEFSRYQQESILKAKELEEKIIDLEAENQQLTSQYQKIAEEKAQLVQSINDFTEKMSFSFQPPSS